MFVDGISDCAIVFFLKEDFKLPDVPITLRPISSPCGIGVEIGWLGYPAIDPDTACFFSGTISARKEARRAYFIDGVAINGVSGGPVFHIPSSEADDIEIIGAISDYYPNMALGQPLPGLAQARDVSHFHAIAGHIKSIDEANAANQQFNLANALTAGTGPTIMETTLIPNNTLTAK